MKKEAQPTHFPEEVKSASMDMLYLTTEKSDVGHFELVRDVPALELLAVRSELHGAFARTFIVFVAFQHI